MSEKALELFRDLVSGRRDDFGAEELHGAWCAIESQLAAKDAEIAAAHEKNARLMEASAELVREKDAEISRLSKIWEMHPVSARNWDRWCAQMEQLESELAAVKAERDDWKRLHDVKNELLAKLVERIESAPKVTVWRNNETGEIHRIHTNGAEGETLTAAEGETLTAAEGVWLPIEVHAVPVEQEDRGEQG